MAAQVDPAIERFHSLDAVRAFALLAGIVLHATMTFIPGFTLKEDRPTLDVSPSATLAVLFFVIHLFRMSVFFVIAGFFARLLVARSGVREFLRNRAKRVLVPLVLSWLLIGPLVLAAVIFQALILYGTLDAVPPPGSGVPLLHLWFLYYLLWCDGLALGARGVLNATVNRGGAFAGALDALLARLVRGELAPLVLAAPLAVALYSLSTWEPWAGIPTPDRGLVPRVAPLLAYGTAFVFGWLVHRATGLLGVLERRSRVYLAVALGLTALALALAGPTFATAEPRLKELGAYRGAYAACYALALWYWTFGLIGLGQRWFARESALTRYLADSSYWLYLAHLPLVFFLGALVSEVPLHWSIKFPAIVAAALALLLSSYRYWVRPTFLGALLNGRRMPPTATALRGSRQPL